MRFNLPEPEDHVSTTDELLLNAEYMRRKAEIEAKYKRIENDVLRDMSMPGSLWQGDSYVANAAAPVAPPYNAHISPQNEAYYSAQGSVPRQINGAQQSLSVPALGAPRALSYLEQLSPPDDVHAPVHAAAPVTGRSYVPSVDEIGRLP